MVDKTRLTPTTRRLLRSYGLLVLIAIAFLLLAIDGFLGMLKGASQLINERVVICRIYRFSTPQERRQTLAGTTM